MHEEMHVPDRDFQRHGQDATDMLGVQVINVSGNCMRDRFDWLVTFIFFLGGESAWGRAECRYAPRLVLICSCQQILSGCQPW